MSKSKMKRALQEIKTIVSKLSKREPVPKHLALMMDGVKSLENGDMPNRNSISDALRMLGFSYREIIMFEIGSWIQWRINGG